MSIVKKIVGDAEMVPGDNRDREGIGYDHCITREGIFRVSFWVTTELLKSFDQSSHQALDYWFEGQRLELFEFDTTDDSHKVAMALIDRASSWGRVCFDSGSKVFRVEKTEKAT